MLNNHALILFQGDSITDCGRDRSNPQSLGGGYPLFLAGDLLEAYPGLHLSALNRGISGNRIVDLFARWREDALNLSPDVISILIGVNDVWHHFARNQGVDHEKFRFVYEYILAETQKALPQTKLVLCEPFILNGSAPGEQFKDWKKEITLRQSTVRQLAEAFGAVFVPLQSAFDEAEKQAPASHWLFDGVHPTPAGHRVIANAWKEQVL